MLDRATDYGFWYEFIGALKTRVAVRGHSMEPTFRDGDFLLVDPRAYRRRNPARGEIVLVGDPRAPGRWLIKRVREVAPDRHFFLVAGDHPAHAGEAPRIGRVGRHQLIGRPWFRYWPPRRLGRIR